MSWLVMQADARALPLPIASIDAIVTDPPYGLGFMGREWDSFSPARVRHRSESRLRKGTERRSEHWPGKMGGVQGGGVPISYDESPGGNRGFQQWCQEWGTELLRVAKPGAHLVCFGGTRTYHRLVAGLEDAGWQIRDQLAWLFGSGFPKNRDVGDGWGTALKPGHEPIVLARAPLLGTVASNVQAHGTGAINVDGCRIGDGPSPSVDRRAAGLQRRSSIFHDPKHQHDPENYARHRPGEEMGRWPGNVALDEEAAALLDEQAGPRAAGNHPAQRTRGFWADKPPMQQEQRGTEGGGASRFFYCPKADRAERNRGLEAFEKKPLHWSSGDQSPGTFQGPGTERAARNHHPTVKPIALMQWLCRLVTPPGGIVLDPFCGSGSTGIAALREGFGFIGVDVELTYCEIARDRIIGDAPLLNTIQERAMQCKAAHHSRPGDRADSHIWYCIKEDGHAGSHQDYQDWRWRDGDALAVPRTPEEEARDG